MQRVDIESIKRLFGRYKNYPCEGVVFLDINPILRDGKSFKLMCDALCETCKEYKGIINKVLAPEARGFIPATVVAQHIEAGLVLARKNGKQPGALDCLESPTEYSNEQLFVVKEAIKSGDIVMIVDDVLATGQTASALVDYVKSKGASVLSLLFITELTYLNGAELIKNENHSSLLKFSSDEM